MSSPAPPHRNVVPSEVGWQFVPQYYTFVNKQPDRLHCFYTKKSTFIHGTEGDDDNKPCHGQQEIHAKITSLGFDDCKVYIHSVDAQSSADGGIIIQVIGEMSNKGEPWRKFVQTFFLAEQPNGYFVLNDIFRFLREETPEDEAPADEQALPEPEPQPVPSQSEPEPVSEPVAPEPEPAREPTPAPTSPPPVPVIERAPSPEPVDEPTHVSAPEPAPVVAVASVAPATNGINGHASPASSAEPKSVSAPVQLPQAAPSGPPSKPTPKTWASLAASNTRSWGSAVAKEVRATTEAPPPPPAAKPAAPQPPPPAAAAAPGTSSPAPAQSNVHPLLAAAQVVNTSHCFVKGVTDPISNAALTQQLTARFGPVKDVDVVRSKACAFIEFISVESAKKAIIASLPTAAGGEGGVWVDGDSTKMRLTVETRKERGERPVSRPRGGGPPGRGAPPTGGSVRGRGGAGRGGAKP